MILQENRMRRKGNGKRRRMMSRTRRSAAGDLSRYFISYQNEKQHKHSVLHW
jgi:hypothetical protein